MSLDANWSTGGHPAIGETGPIVLVFPNTAANFDVTDDIPGLNVDKIQFTGAAKSYVLSGAAGTPPVVLTLTGAAASQPNIDDQVGSNTISGTNLSLALAATTSINVTVGSLTLSSPVTGKAALSKTGSGALILSGNNALTGVSTIQQGALEVDTSAGDISLAGGTLTGSGTVGTVSGQPPAAAPAAGTIAPGGSGSAAIGTLRGQTVTMGAPTTFSVDLSHISTGAPAAGRDNDLLAVTGDIFLGGATLTGSPQASVQVGDRFTVIQTTGGTVHGAFAQGATLFLGGQKFSVDTSDPTKVVLQRVQANTSVSVSSSANPAAYGQTVLYTATVAPEAGAGAVPVTGTVTFTFDGVAYPAVNVANNGQAVFDPQKAIGGFLGVTTPATLHTLHAAYSGNALLNASAADLTPAQTVTHPNLGDQTLSYRQSTLTIPLPPGDTVTSAGSIAFYLHRDLALSLAAGGLFHNALGMNEKWLQGKTNAFGNPWYFIKLDGQLLAWDGTAAAAQSTVVGVLDPVYYSYPDLVYNATSDTLDVVLRQRLGLTFGGSLFQDYGGRNEVWLRGNLNQYGNPWYFIVPTGHLYAWDGAPNQATGTLLAALDSLFWAEPERLYKAQPEPTATITGGVLQVTTKQVTTGKNWAGRLVVEVNGTVPAAFHQIFTLNFVNHAPVLTVTPGNQATRPGQPLSFTVSANDSDGDTVTPTPVVGHLGYVLKQSLGLRLQGSLFVNYGGQNEEWLQSTLGNWYFIKPNGQLVFWDGTPGRATGTTIQTLDPIYYYHPDLVYNAPAGDLASALDQRLGLAGTTANFSQNYGGLNEKWVLGSDGWYFILPNGQLFKWSGALNQATGALNGADGNVDPAVGTLVASLDPLYYTDISRLIRAPAGAVTVGQTGNTLTVTPGTNFIGDVWLLPHASDGILVVSGTPMHLSSRTDTITFWEMTGTLAPYTFAFNSPQMTTRLTDPLGSTNADFVTAAHEYYDVFFSNADGSFNSSGSFVTVECKFDFASPFGGGFNIARIDINLANGTVSSLDTLTSSVSSGNNAIAGSAANAVDGNLTTWTTMGNTLGDVGRLRITVLLHSGD
jgi:autotransporter-associated beta strand protein